MNLVTYNLNGIRSAIQKSLIDWLATQRFNVLCFQEVKATYDVVDLAPFAALGITGMLPKKRLFGCGNVF